MKAAVIGSPISHSLSPFIFAFIARAENRACDYQSIEVSSNEGLNFFHSLKNEKGLLGCNVTLPLKELFLNEIDFSSPEVKALGALNVLHIVNGSEIHGFNTDIIGIQKTLENKNFSVLNKTCFLLGAGGSAKAVAYVLGNQKAKEVLIFNRSDRNNELVKKFSDLFPDTIWRSVNSFEEKNKIDLIINSTPLGMTGKESGKDFFKSIEKLAFNPKALAFDLIYTPEETEFLIKADSLGLDTVGGLGMLIDQALATWKIWLGHLSNEDELHQKLKDFLNGILKLRQNPNPIYLTGFMGVGKSSVAAFLASLIQRIFLDTDKLTEASASLSISEMFALKGEPFFRALENKTIAELVSSGSSKNSVISLGGGVLMNQANFDLISTSGTLIYLSADEDTLLERIKGQDPNRPLLANLDTDAQLEKIKELLKTRKSTYQKADIEINTNGKSLRDIAFDILVSLGQLKEKENK